MKWRNETLRSVLIIKIQKNLFLKIDWAKYQSFQSIQTDLSMSFNRYQLFQLYLSVRMEEKSLSKKSQRTSRLQRENKIS